MSTAGASALVSERPASRAEFLRVIWTLAWPVILTMSIESFVGIADMKMLGRLGKEVVAGVGIATQILFALNTVIMAIGTATLAIVARHIGAGERSKAEDVVGQSLILAAVFAALVSLPVILYGREVVALFGAEPAVVQAGGTYLSIVLIGAAADAVFIVGAFALRGAGDTRTPLMVGLLLGVIKILSSYTLIFGHFGMPELREAGAAIGSVIAFFAGAGALVALLAGRTLILRLHRRHLVPEWGTLKRVFSLGYPAALENALMQFGFMLYYYFAEKFSTGSLAAYVIGVRILGMSFLPGMGFSAAAAALVGQNLGAQRPEEALRSGWEATRLAIALMSAAGLLIFVEARTIAEFFIQDESVLVPAVSFIRVLAAAQPLMAIDFTLSGALRGAGDTRFPLYVVLIGFYLCRLAFAYAATFVFRDVNDGGTAFWLWFALVPDYIVRAILKGWRFRSGRWKHIRV